MTNRKNKIERSNLEHLDRPIAFHRVFADLTGSIHAALLLSQALYWQRRCPDGRDGWWWKTSDEWFEEARLTRREQQKARKTLVKLGILEETKKGVPCRLWYRLDLNNLMLLIQSAEPRQPVKMVKPVCRNTVGKFTKSTQASAPKKRQTISKNTSEIPREESKDYPAEGGQVETIGDEKRQILDLEMKFGVVIPQSLIDLQSISRISHILQKEKLEAEVVRLLFAEFDACCKRREVKDHWALFMTLVRKATAQKLHLSTQGEQQMPPWV